METKESFIPYIGKIIDIKQETPDVKTFSVVGLDGKNCSSTSRDSVQCSLFQVSVNQ